MLKLVVIYEFFQKIMVHGYLSYVLVLQIFPFQLFSFFLLMKMGFFPSHESQAILFIIDNMMYFVAGVVMGYQCTTV